MTPAFSEHMTLAQQHPAYWSYLTTLEFIDGIVAEMEAQGVCGAELARRMGTSRAWVSRVLAGECNLTLASMGKLAFALGMKVTTGLVPADRAVATPAEATTPAESPPARRRKSA
jgi:transcriptional regulator with XRE-family HTH domain